ncbi:ORF6N domain-containing protein [bacterium]|nr:ORF6N domain-containing protein [bacterium]
MLDSDLASLYCVETKVLNQTVKRNIQRFPEDFMFQLSKEEYETLRSQFVTSKQSNEKRGGRQYLPYVFTEQGIAMLSGLLNTDIAIAVNINIMRTFVKMRKLAIEHKDLQEQINEFKKVFIQYARDNNKEIARINEAIDLLMDRTKPAKIGFKTEN